MPSLRVCIAAGLGIVSFTTLASAQVFDLRADWSETSNPNGAWSYRHGDTPLPHVDAWQRNLGGWTIFQPGWARSEDSNTRLPFWFRSNGSEAFAHDFVAGDIIVHTTDVSNGSGSGLATVAWSAPSYGSVTMNGSVWLGRDIGRATSWSVLDGGTTLTGGDLFSGDQYSRALPFDLATGSGGAAPLQNRTVCRGDEIRLQLNNGGAAGEFVGVNLTITFTPLECPPDWNRDGCLSSQDFFDFLVSFFAGKADFNDDAVTNSQDFFDYLTSFFQGC